MLIIIRLYGFFVSLDFYFSTRNLKFLILIFAWALWIVAAIFPIFSDIILNDLLSDFFLLLNAIFASNATLFLLFGLLYYIYRPSKKILTISVFLIIILPTIIFMFNRKSATNLALLFQSIFYILAFVMPLIRYKKFKSQIGKSIRWYFGVLITLFIYIPITMIIFLQGYSYGLYDVSDEFIIFLNYIPPISATFMIIIFLIHIDYSNSTILKNKLKDQYSHDLGNILQVVLGIGDLLKLKEAVEESERENLNLLKMKSKEASKLINEIRKLE